MQSGITASEARCTSPARSRCRARPDLKIRLVNHKGTRGPAQLVGVIGLWPVATAAAVVPKKEGWSEKTTVGPLRRGPLMAHDFKLSSTDLLGLFARRTRSQ